MNWQTTGVPKEIRKAITESAYGRSGMNVFGRDVNNNEFRIIDVKTHRATTYGKRLNDGKWVVIYTWREA